MSTKVHFIWVGQGDCTLIQTDTNKLILIDCGTSDNMSIYDDNVKPSIEKVLTDTGKTSIDYLILTHSDKDHCNLVSSLFEFTEFKEMYYGGNIWQYAPYVFDGLSVNSKIKKVNELDPHYSNLFATAIIDETDFKMWIIGGNFPYSHSPPNTPFAKDINRPSNRNKQLRSIYDNNGNSLIVVISYKGFQMMFMGDATVAQQDFLYGLAEKDGKLGRFQSKVFKMSHHGSADSFSNQYANKAVKPAGVIASAGVTFGHPSEQTIDTITTVMKSGRKDHELVMYDDDEDEYYRWDQVDEYIYNTMQWFNESSITVPTTTPSGKRSRNKHAGSPYLEIIGSNWTFEITGATTANIIAGDRKTILTTKRTTAVTSKRAK